MFVLEALVLTFMTTPAVSLLYPAKYRVRAVPVGQNFATVEGDTEGADDRKSSGSGEEDRKSRFTIVLDRMEHLPGMMAVTQLLQPTMRSVEETTQDRHAHISIDAVRLIELSGSVFADVMRSSHAESLLKTDPVLSVFRTFGDLHDLPVSAALSVVSYEDQAGCIVDHAKTADSHMVVLPWLPPWQSNEGARPTEHGVSTGVHTPAHAHAGTSALGNFFNPATSNIVSSGAHAHFVRGVFAQAPCAVALFMDRVRPQGSHGRRAPAKGMYHLVVPFFGGPDDRLALDFVVQLCADAKVSATVLRISRREASELDVDVRKPQAAHTTGAEKDHAHTHLTVQSVREYFFVQLYAST
jgi:hypothetical protein